MLAATIAAARAPVARISPALPGLALAVAIAAVARLCGALSPLPPVFSALVLGMVAARLVPPARLAQGIAVASQPVLRFGVALLGAAITFAEIGALGWMSVAVTLAALVVTLVAGTALCRRLGEARDAAIVSAAAVAICGASAALAVAAILGRGGARQEDTARTVAGITIAGTVALLAFPAVGSLLGLSDAAMGVFLGGSIHEVAQAAASGFAVSEEAGKTAAVVKMVRVACLGPIVLVLGAFACREPARPGARPPLVPAFLLGFAALAALSSTGLIPPLAREAAVTISQWCLLVAIAALGMRTSFAGLLARGPRPLLAIAVNSLLLAALMACGVLFIVGH
ncbi:putative sulfate exporter family transporter [Altererythrobacter soli]|uniref:Putative sulfate exporter family transporter n=1 Tax=Croceibacterium soli TaxID=1739690 RepID=A0A6I4UZC8_9SPHN|nr:putative sulfate exporter family transporter [Croceibacterium soli]MXP42597.1 putative sulfate exporter family transporter [Croceibacterium soli]